MSKIRLHGSSSGYMEIAPPAAGSSETITLPNSAGEVLLSDGSAASLTQIPAANIVGVATAGFGNGILQVVQTFKSDTTSFTSNSQTTFSDISGMSVSITPSNSSNKILVFFTANVSCSSQNRNNTIRLLRDSTVVGAGTAGSTVNGSIIDRTKDDDILDPKSNMFLDSPSTTSAITYKLQWTCEGSGGNQTYYLNRRATSTGQSSASHITVMEVAA